jgi:hypothetical protein
MNREEVARRLVKIAKNLVAEDILTAISKAEDVARRVKGIKKVVSYNPSWGNFEVITDDGDPLEFNIMKNGDIVWQDFSHKTWMGNVFKPNTVKKQLDALLKTDGDEFSRFKAKHKYTSPMIFAKNLVARKTYETIHGGTYTDKEVAEYLNDLRESGQTNMWHAGSFLESDLELTRRDAKRALMDWMRSFKASRIAQDDDIPDVSGMQLNEIARLIARDWRNVYFGAKPYLQAMMSLRSVRDDYGLDSGRSIVMYFLSNASSWRGPLAKEVKKELKKRLKK